MPGTTGVHVPPPLRSRPVGLYGDGDDRRIEASLPHRVGEISVHVGDAMDHPSHRSAARVSYTSVGEAVGMPGTTGVHVPPPLRRRPLRINGDAHVPRTVARLPHVVGEISVHVGDAMDHANHRSAARPEHLIGKTNAVRWP